MILAYIDPGSGSLFIQALIAALISVPFVFRSAVGRAVRRARALKSGRSDGAADETQTPG